MLTSKPRTAQSRLERTDMEYKGFYIDDCMYGMITVQYCGDDVVFRSVEDAKQFIDEIAEA